MIKVAIGTARNAGACGVADAATCVLEKLAAAKAPANGALSKRDSAILQQCVAVANDAGLDEQSVAGAESALNRCFSTRSSLAQVQPITPARAVSSIFTNAHVHRGTIGGKGQEDPNRST